MATVILKVCWQHTARRNIKTIGASDRVDAASVIFRSGSGSAASGQWIESGIGVGDETIKMSDRAESSTTPLFGVTFTISDSSTSKASSTSELDMIAANDLTSRANYAYSFLAGLAFLAGCFLLYSFLLTYRAQGLLAWLDRLLGVFCSIQLLLVLLSLHAVAYRPDYLRATGLGCAALSFAVNTASLCGLLVLVLMAYVLTQDPPAHAPLRKPGVCVSLVILASLLVCLLLAGLRGPHSSLQEEAICFMDPVKVSYAIARLCLAFLVPYILQLGLLISGCIQQWKSKGRFLHGFEEGPVFLTISSVMFFCQLFYGVTLVKDAHLGEEALGSQKRAFLSVAEFVLFSGSSASLLLVLLVHRPRRASLYSLFQQLRDCCQSPRRSQPSRNIIAPHIEITDTLQDIES